MNRIPYILALLFCCTAYGSWEVLLDKEQKPVQVAVDFAVKSVRFENATTATVVAAAIKDGVEIGFVATLDLDWKSRKVAVPGEKEQYATIAEGEVTIKSLGDATTALERSLDQQLGIKHGKEGNTHVTGLYGARSRVGPAAIRQILVFDLLNVGLTLDANGNKASGDRFFEITVLLDASMKRLVVYFAPEAGYGGKSRSKRAREDWYDAQQRSSSNNH